jgi:hypothetical protein
MLELVQAAALALAVLSVAGSCLFGLTLALHTHRVQGDTVRLSDGVLFTDRPLEHTELGVGLAIVFLGAVVAAAATCVAFAVRPQLQQLQAEEHRRQVAQRTADDLGTTPM